MLNESRRFLLAINTVSDHPSASIVGINDDKVSSISLLKTSKQESTYKFEAALFSNLIFELCDSFQCKAHQISHLAFCPGPGPFSSIRVSIIFARILKHLNPALAVYKLDLLYLYFRYLRENKLIPDDVNDVCMKAGLTGFFRAQYSLPDCKAQREAHLVKEVGTSYLLEPQFAECELSEFMLEILRSDNLTPHLISSLADIEPLYLKPPSVTQSKKNGL